MKPPSVSRDEWWCSAEEEYGFLGFSYPLEDGDCNAYSNSFDSMNKDFAEMKQKFGAKYVRLYYPVCTEKSVFENALRAGVANNMAVIPQIWFNFGDDNPGVWQRSQAALVAVLDDPTYGAIAPYVFHSADFGSEPIGDGVDGGNDQFVNDLGKFRSLMNKYGIPGGFSDDWDRGQMMNGQQLTDLGKRALSNSDFLHLHPMPFYHGNLYESQAWDYITGQVERMRAVSQKPIMLTETQWAWGPTEHYPGHNDIGHDQYAAYWNAFNDNCAYFKQQRVGWFLHAYNNEGSFSMKHDDGFEINGWYGKTC